MPFVLSVLKSKRMRGTLLLMPQTTSGWRLWVSEGGLC